jgi:hypothetical protein
VHFSHSIRFLFRCSSRTCHSFLSSFLQLPLLSTFTNSVQFSSVLFRTDYSRSLQITSDNASPGRSVDEHLKRLDVGREGSECEELALLQVVLVDTHGVLLGVGCAESATVEAGEVVRRGRECV